MEADYHPEKLFDAFYFKHCCGAEYVRSDVFMQFFGNIAERIVRDFAPATALDAGCAIGILVEALRARGVDARGFDISDYAVRQVPEFLTPYIQKGSVLDPNAVSGCFDIVICMEVVEHLLPADADLAIENLCRWSDRIVFSSTPDHYDEATHFNVQQPGYWVEKFARHGFIHVLDYDVSYITPWAMLLQRQNLPWPTILRGYEDKLWRTMKESSDLRRAVNTLQTDARGLRILERLKRVYIHAVPAKFQETTLGVRMTRILRRLYARMVSG